MHPRTLGLCLTLLALSAFVSLAGCDDVFWTFGRRAGERIVATSRFEVPLVEVSEESQRSGQAIVDSQFG